MPYSHERPSNLLQFLYAAGVVVLLIASLFLTLEWDYARELFGLGLVIEILVFLLSAIDPVTSKGIPSSTNGPEREISFPPKRRQRNPDRSGSEASVEQNLGELETHMKQLVQTNRELERSIEVLNRDQREYEQRRSDYESELEEIRKNIERTQQQLKELSRK